MKKLQISACVFLLCLGMSPVESQARGNFFSRSQSVAGPEYNFKHFQTLSIAGFKLHMSTTEANEIIVKDQWKGGWLSSSATSPATIETTAYPFRKGTNNSITLYRYRRSDDNSLHIYAIDFEMGFDQDQDIKILTEKLIEKYGTPTNISTSGSDVILQYSPDNTMFENQECQYSYKRNPLDCKAYVNWKLGPKMTIQVSPKLIEINLEDQKEALIHKNNIETRERVYNNQQQQDTTEDIDLDF